MKTCSDRLTPDEDFEIRQRRYDAELAFRGVLASAGPLYANSRINNFEITNADQRAVIDSLKEFIQSGQLVQNIREGRNLIFMGPRGTGKDHLGIACLRAAAALTLSTTAWFDGQEMFRGFRGLISRGSDEEEHYQQFIDPDVLMLSDPLPQTGDASQYQRSNLWMIVDHRSRFLRSTWATLNVVNQNEAEERLGQQLADRLFDRALVVGCRWGTYRRVGR